MKLWPGAIFLFLLISVLLATGCGTPAGSGALAPVSSPISTAAPPSITPPETSATGDQLWNELRQQVADARQIADSLISLIPQNKVWLVTQPPADGEQVRLLTSAEEAQILEVANAFAPVKEARAKPAVTGVAARDYFWKSYSRTAAVTVSNIYLEKRGISQKLSAYFGDQNYPGVFLLFHTRYDNYAYAEMNLVVDLRQQKVIYAEGLIKAAELPPEDLANVNPVSFTLDYYPGDILNPLDSGYDPSAIYGPDGTRFGPPWDRGPGITVTPGVSPAPTPSLTVTPGSS